MKECKMKETIYKNLSFLKGKVIKDIIKDEENKDILILFEDWSRFRVSEGWCYSGGMVEMEKEMYNRILQKESENVS
jgi:hypothetical protein